MRKTTLSDLRKCDGLQVRNPFGRAGSFGEIRVVGDKVDLVPIHSMESASTPFEIRFETVEVEIEITEEMAVMIPLGAAAAIERLPTS